jgi:sulfite reductase (ferredoxin)
LSKRHHRFRKKNHLFKGKIDEERFRSLRGTWRLWSAGRCSNDTYQVAFGKVTNNVAYIKVSDEYSTGRLHITTRQDKFTM